MKEELKALVENQTLDLVSYPTDITPIGCKWVYTIELKANGSLDRHKARSVALGNNQEYGLDYDETFALVAKMTTIRTLIAVTMIKSWPLLQMDIKKRVSSWRS